MQQTNYRRFTCLWPRIFILLWVWGITSCHSYQSAARAESMSIILQADKDINPNEKGNANPVRVTLYQLKQSDAFMMSDYFTLEAAADPELMRQTEKSTAFIMAPGEKKTLTLNIQDEVNAIGVVTAYRDISYAQWRVIYPIPHKPRAKWYALFWPRNEKWQPKVNVQMKYLTTSIEKVE